MGLTPLEYLDCFLDSPTFRETVQVYEKELDANSAQVKNLARECRRLITATEEFSKVQNSFAHTMKSFKFEIIGEGQTQEEIMISQSLQEFADVLSMIEEHRCTMLGTISARMLETLEKFRKEQIQSAKDEKRKFERVSEKYYNSLEKYLGQGVKKKDLQAAHEYDSALFKDQAQFRQMAFQYACQLQDLHAAKQYELVEPILGYIGDVTTFFHQAYDTALSTKPQLEKAQFRVQLLRETHKQEQEKAYQLKAKVIEEGEQGLLHHPQYIKQGFLMVQEKKIGGLTHTWTRYFCQFSKADDVQFLRLITIGQHNKPEFYQVKQCIRCKSDDTDRRFCIEVEMYVNRGENITKKFLMQAMKQSDMKEWLEVMEGREPTYATMPAPKVTAVRLLTQAGYEYVVTCTQALEKRGLTEEGIYRKPGITSKATKLMKDAIEKGKMDQDIDDQVEVDTKTLASALKLYFSKQLSEPLMTFKLYDLLINSAKHPSYSDRVHAIADLISRLPKMNYKVLELFIDHLAAVACHSNYNLMQASNLGVVFGPTLMRPEMETVASIKDIKYQNIVVEIMIDEKDKLFTRPAGGTAVDSPKPSRAAPFNTTSATMSSSTENIADPPLPKSSPVTLSLPPSHHQQQKPKHDPVSTTGTPQTSSGGSGEGQVVVKPVRRAAPRPPPPPPQPGKKIGRSMTSETLGTHSNKSTPSPPAERNSNHVSEKFRERIVEKKEESLESQSRLRAATTVTPVMKKPDFMSSPKVALLKKRNHSDSFVPSDTDNRLADHTPDGEAPPIPWRSGSSRRARTLYDCDTGDPNELNFKKGQILNNVKPSDEPGWLLAALNKRTGLVPENYIELLS